MLINGNWSRHATYQQIVVYAGGLFIGMNFDTMIYLSAKPRLFMKNVDLAVDKGRESLSAIILGVYI